MTSPSPPEDSVPVEINGQSIDPQDVYARDAHNTNYIVITARSILSITEEEELQALGVTFVEDLGELNFLCNYEQTDLTPIRSKEFVRQVDVYRNKFKIPAGLEASTEHVHACEVDVLVHGGVGDMESLAGFIAREARVSVSDMEMVPGKIRLTIDPCRLEAIVKDDRIRIVEEVLRPSLHDDTARRIINGSAEMMAGSAYRGKGQIVTVTDSGFDKGCLEDCHPAFTGKVLSLVPVVRRDSTKFSEKQKVNDPNGHGTHVCGIILGSDFDTSEGLIGGIAPDAKLIVQSLWNNAIRNISLPMDTSVLLTVPYSQGSRIFSNSWGVGWLETAAQQPDYAEPAKVIDNFVRDNPDALVCFSAGNDHVHSGGRPAVGLEAGAKNVLTIGASGTTRPVNEASDQMWQSSSHGPSREGRLKPDVIAPGVQVYSALSREAKYFGKGAVNERFPDVKWKPLSGTSQATPLVAGCAAVLREVLQEKGCQSPPGALLKALIINGADRLPGVDANAQGFGRVNLTNSIATASTFPAKSEDASTRADLTVFGGTLIGAALKQDEEFEFVIPSSTVTNPKTGFKITMVYNDIGAKEIQNNLNIIVTDVDKDEVEYGNTKSLTQTDLQNNVEQVVLSYVPTGNVGVKVHAQKIFAGSEQDYVLAWSTFIPL